MGATAQSYKFIKTLRATSIKKKKKKKKVELLDSFD